MNQPDLVVKGGTLVTMDKNLTIFENAYIEVKNGRITKIESNPNPQILEGVKILDAKGALITPGLINGHTHTGMTLLRGVADDLPLKSWLHDYIFPLEKKWGTKEFVYLGTMLAGIEMIRSGTTFCNDMYYFEESAARAFNDLGMRAICGQTVVEISGVEADQDIFEKFDEYLSNVSSYLRVIPALAPHSIYGVSAKTWGKIVDYAEKKKLRIHLHLSETEEETQNSIATLKMTPTEFFESIGLWKLKALAAHATCITEKDIAILGKSKVGVAYNPESNLKLGTKICPVVELRKAGAKIVLGTDGVASNNDLDLLSEIDMGAKLQTYKYGIGSFKTTDAFKIMTSEGAEALGVEHEVGSIEVGKAADFIAIDTSASHALPMYSPYSQLIYSLKAADVRHSVIGGTVVMENWKLTQVDEVAILQEVKEWGRKIKEDL